MRLNKGDCIYGLEYRSEEIAFLVPEFSIVPPPPNTGKLFRTLSFLKISDPKMNELEEFWMKIKAFVF